MMLKKTARGLSGLRSDTLVIILASNYICLTLQSIVKSMAIYALGKMCERYVFEQVTRFFFNPSRSNMPLRHIFVRIVVMSSNTGLNGARAKMLELSTFGFRKAKFSRIQLQNRGRCATGRELRRLCGLPTVPYAHDPSV